MEPPSNSKKLPRTIEFPADAPVIVPPESFLGMCAHYGLSLDPDELERLARFLSLMLATNEIVNLTSITDHETAWEKHIFDALSLLPIFQALAEGAKGRLKAADIGSGGGVPAIPLAIVLPGFDFTLVESTGKKASFLTHAIATLGLPNVRVLSARAEEIGQDHRVHRGRYDAVTARAVGRIAVTSELTAPLAKVGGMVILTKGERAEEELREASLAIKTLGLAHAGTHETPTGRIVVLEKIATTPRTYPRRSGEPKRAPIGVPPAGVK